jgi:hypothetical protein
VTVALILTLLFPSRSFMLKRVLRMSPDAVRNAGQRASKAATEALAAVGTGPRVKCTRLFVPAAAQKQKFLSSPAVTAQFTASTVSAKTEDKKLSKNKKA